MGIYGKNIYQYRESILTEAYIGKSDTLKEIEDAIGELRKAVKKFKDNNNIPEILKLNRLFEKQFGMEVFALHVDQSSMKNAWTLPIAKRYDVVLKGNFSNYVTGNVKTGYKFKKDNGLCIVCTVTLGLLQDENITNEEILAVILHEIGHNFADAIYNTIGVYNRNLMISIILMSFFTALVYVVTGQFALAGAELASILPVMLGNTNVMVKNSELNKSPNHLSGFMQGVSSSIGDFNAAVSSFFDRTSFGIGNYVYKLFNIFNRNQKGNINRYNEVLADKFATIYGYGPAIQTALSKFSIASKTERIVDNIPLVGPLMNMSYYNSIKDLCNYDCHPQIIQRINTSITSLKSEIEKANIDPKMVKVIKSQIEQLEKLKDELSKVDKNTNMTKLEVAKATYNAYVDKKLPEAIYKDIEKDIDDAFDKILKEQE